MGAWIEIFAVWVGEVNGTVAPIVGAWIEIVILLTFSLYDVSLLSWERGLKLKYQIKDDKLEKSLLSWERGLK